MKKIRSFIFIMAAVIMVASNSVTVEAAKNSTASKSVTAKAAKNSLVEKIAKAGSTSATCETSIKACVVDVNDKENPYGVKWDFGKDYNALINDSSIDWSLVFDVKYYKKQFPALALQYHDNDKLLFEHYKTVGMHEGRQANNKFNPLAYGKICNKELKTAFGNNNACYILYYLLKGYKEVKNADIVGKNEPKQLSVYTTIVQDKEYRNVNKGRKNVSVDKITIDSELMAIAEYRAYVDTVGNYKAHDWVYVDGHTDPIFEALNVANISENTIKTTASDYAFDWYSGYYSSKPHREGMFNKDNKFIGISNPFVDYKLNRLVQFDMFIPASENYVPDFY